MKNSLLGINIVLAMAVAVLFYFQFGRKNNVASAANTFHQNGVSFKIAYFEMDSVENNYEYLKDVRNVLRQMEQQKSNELAELRNSQAKEWGLSPDKPIIAVFGGSLGSERINKVVSESIVLNAS